MKLFTEPSIIAGVDVLMKFIFAHKCLILPIANPDFISDTIALSITLRAFY